MAILSLDDGIVFLNDKKLARVHIENDGENAAERLRWWNVGDAEHAPSYITSDPATIRALEKWLKYTATDVVAWHKGVLQIEARQIIARAKAEQAEEERLKQLADHAERVGEIANDVAADYPNYPLEKYMRYAQYAVVEQEAARTPESFKYWHDFIDPPF
jgi:hypothetical protein